MSETAYIDELLKAEKEADEIIKNAQKERYFPFYLPSGSFFSPSHITQAAQIEGSTLSRRARSQ